MEMGESQQSYREAQRGFSRLLQLGRLGARSVDQHIEANVTERDSVARRLGLEALQRLEADISVCAKAGGKLIEVEGDLHAHVTQTCVVTLEPVESEIREHFLQRYTTEAAFAQSDEVVVDVEEEDAPEPITGDEVDLGEAVVQQLALALDPYPRKSGAELEWQDDSEEESNPFAVLKRLRNDDKE